MALLDPLDPPGRGDAALRGVLPGSWVLAPGLAVTRRSADELQVGHDDHALVVADGPGVRSLLDRLAGAGATWRPGEHDRLWSRLLDRQLVVPATALADDLAAGGGHDLAGPRAAAVAAAYAAHGRDATAVLARRRQVRAGLLGRTAWTTPARRLLLDGGLRTAEEGAAPTGADVWLVADATHLADDLLRDGVPHLVVAPATRDAVRIGPFVVPGATCCVRCLAATRADRDPAAGVVDLQRARVAALPLGPRAGRVPDPEDATVVALALAWAARDLLTWAGGGRPTTWCATVVVDHGLQPVVTPGAPHPRCGCTWDRG